MIRYVPSSAAEPLSAALWNLASPPGQRAEGATSLMFGWVDDLHGQRWLEVHDDFSIIVHPDAVLGPIASILQPWVGQGLAQADIDALAALVLASRGQRLTLWDAFPALFKDQSLDLPGMIAAEKLNEPGGIL
jgi:hypothetical protein